MALEDDARRILRMLVESPDEKGMRAFVKAAIIQKRLRMPELRINDAMRWMETQDWVEVRRSVGTAPFVFDSAQVKPNGIIEYDRLEKLRNDRPPPAPAPATWLPFNKGSLEHRREVQRREAALERAESNRRSLENQLRGGEDDEGWEPDPEPDHDYDIVEEVHREEQEAREALIQARKELAEAERLENVDFTRTAIHALSDDPIANPKLDALGSEDLANSFAAVLDSPRTPAPLVAAISGPWGSGKSSVGNLVAHKLGSRTATGAEFPHVVAQFNVWMHQDAKRIEIALMSSLARTIHCRDGHLPLFGVPTQFLRPHQRLFRVILYSIVLAAALLLAVHEYGLPLPASQRAWIGALAIAGGIAGSLLPTAVGVTKWILNYARRPEAETQAGMLKEARDSWAKYVDRRLPPGVRLVVFLEDLDRCSPQQTVRLIECINQLLPNHRTLVVLVGDVKVLAQHVGAEWLRPVKPDSTAAEQFEAGSRFLQKIIQLRFEVPQVTEDVIWPFIAQASKPPAKPPAWHRRPIEAWKREVNEWRKGSWSRPRMMRNPFWGRGTNPIDWVLGLLWEPLHVMRMAVVWTRYWLVPAEIKAEFRPPGSRALIAFRTTLVVAEFVLWAWIVARLAQSDSTELRLLAATLLFAVALPLFLTMIYGAPVALLTGLGMGSYLRLRYRREAKRAEGGKEWVQQQRSAHGATSAPDYPEEDDDKLGAALRSALEHAKHPRMAKRIVTRLRFEMLCFNSRNLVGKHAVSPQLLGAWVVFVERWPSLYQRVLDNPSILEEWESNPSTLRLESDGQEAWKFFQRPIKLSQHVRTFLHYRLPPMPMT